jgi:hypothetical protein
MRLLYDGVAGQSVEGLAAFSDGIFAVAQGSAGYVLMEE